MTTNIFEFLEVNAARHPEKVALNDDKHSVTFLEWLDGARRFGSAILVTWSYAHRE